ncbi:MAG: hypothetical protein HY709_06065 [Candidatus Latescibacteria bacterium]|nr:hypothetical protein [Candidatus Latescibacterota bacterium]
MPSQPVEIILNLTPKARFDIIDVAAKISDQYGDLFQRYRKTLCCSFHTTAGYLEQRFCARFDYSLKRLDQFLRIFQNLFPPNAGYFHDCMELRNELSDSEKAREPVNTDSHLTFISAGLKNCVTYINRQNVPIYFIDLDGVYKQYRRNRRTTILTYNEEEITYRGTFPVPVTTEHSIDSFNLKDPRYGFFTHLNDLLESYGIEKGRIDIRLAPEERHAGLTVNEYETLLMRNDLPEAIRNPLQYMVRRGKKLLRHPSSIPGKTRDYAIYDLIHLYNTLMDNVQIGRSVTDRVLSYLSAPASRLFQLKRHISLFVSNSVETGPDRIVQGRYQSPILLQHQATERGVRYLEVLVWNFR